MKTAGFCSIIFIAAMSAAASVQAASCIKKGGGGWGVTKGHAELNALGAIKMLTGNWPIVTDRISDPVYKCASGATGWNCKAYATVCKKA
ncbi:MAG: hypothetical protein SGJ17_00830 [Hyphomicrobiales bacterium]|nr:hypothetical protein [Hyphomicrobiales bacterium]